MKFSYTGKLSATAVDAGKQDLLRGNHYQVEITCYDENNSPITLAGKDVAFIIRRQRQSSTITYVIREDDMTISGSTATITLNSGITLGLVRSYYWEFGINFADNQVNTLAYGAFNFEPSELATAIADEFDPPTLIDPTPWLETMETNLASSESAKTGALASEVKAGKWAEEDEDVQVETGKYSAKHHSLKSKASETAAVAAKDGILNDTGFQAVATDLAGANTIGEVAGIKSDVSAVSSIKPEIININGIKTSITNLEAIINEIVAVDGINANVTTVAGIALNVTTVAGISANVTTIAGIAANVTTVAGIATNVTTVAGISTEVVAVDGNKANIDHVAGIRIEVATVSGIRHEVTTVSGISTEVVALDGIKTNITSLDTVKAEIAGVDGIKDEVVAVDGIKTSVPTVAGIAANVTTVAGIAADVTTVAGVSANVTTVAGISANITTVAGISGDVTTVAGISGNVTTVAGIETEILAVPAQVTAAEAATVLSEKWAEGTLPGGAGTKSSKEHAEDAGTVAQGAVDTHSALDTGVHGVGESTVETTAGAQAKVDALENSFNNVKSFVNVKEYGAIGDGTTDDAAAFNTAVNYCVTNSRTLYLPKGEYNLSGFVDRAVNGNLYMKGAGNAEVILKNGDGRFLCKGDIYIDNVTFKDFDFASTRYLFQIDNDEVETGEATTKRVVVTNCIFENMPGAVGKRNTNRIVLDYAYFVGNILRKMHYTGFLMWGIEGKYSMFANNQFIDFDTAEGVGSSAWAIGCGANATVDTNKNIFVVNNHFENIVGVVGGENHAVLCYGTNIVVNGNIIDGIYAWTSLGVKGGADDTEAIYAKGNDIVITSNVIINGCVGSGDAAITTKGAEDSKYLIVANNVVLHDMENYSARALRATGASVVSGNILVGRVRCVTSSVHTFHEKHHTINGNIIYGQFTVEMSDQSESCNITGNTIIQDDVTKHAITSSGNDTKTLNITGNNIYGHGGLLDLTGAVDTVIISNNNFYYSRRYNMFMISRVPKQLIFDSNNIMPREVQLEGTAMTNFHRLRAIDSLLFTNNNIKLLGEVTADRFEFRVADGANAVLKINNNVIEYLTPKPYDVSGFFVTRGDYMLWEIHNNTILNVDIDVLASVSSYNAIHKLSIKNNFFDNVNRLVAMSHNGFDVLEVVDNVFQKNCRRLHNAHSDAPVFHDRLRLIVSGNHGWRTENGGRAMNVANGGSVSHLLRLAPTVVNVTPLDKAAPSLYVSGLSSSSSFQVNYDNTAGGEFDFMWEAKWRFPEPAAPTTPTLVSPANEATGVAVQPSLSVSHTEGIAIQIQIATAAGFKSGDRVFDRLVIPKITGGNKVFDLARAGFQLQPGTLYYWRVKPMYGTGGDFTAAFSFTTAP